MWAAAARAAWVEPLEVEGPPAAAEWAGGARARVMRARVVTTGTRGRVVEPREAAARGVEGLPAAAWRAGEARAEVMWAAVRWAGVTMATGPPAQVPLEEIAEAGAPPVEV